MQPDSSASDELDKLRGMADDADALSDLDAILAAADTSSPWVMPAKDEEERIYQPDYDLARQLLAVPISQGAADEQQSGRVAKALDGWIAHELRRAGFPDGAVWPRASRPRVLPADLAPVEEAITAALARLDDFEGRLAQYAQQAAEEGLARSAPSVYRLGPAIRQIGKALPGASAANILGRFYVKQVDVVVSSWEHGPDVLVSTKTQFSSYLNNKNNRYEEAVGEITNLRDRHPMAAMGFAFLVRSNLLDEQGAFAYLCDLLVRLRKPDGAFDATMLLVGEWDEDTLTLSSVEDASPLLSAGRFFRDLLTAVMSNTPVDLHQEIRRRWQGEPPGGLPPSDDPG
jgi:hypothetical protein